MKTVYFYAGSFRAALVATMALAMAPDYARAGAGPTLRALSEITLDIDQDGKMDRAVLVAPEETGPPGPDQSYMFGADDRVHLYIYLGSGNEALDLTRQPTFIVRDIVSTKRQNQIFPLENRGGAMIIKSAYNLFSNWVPETLTIVYRKGELWVGGYALSYELKNGARGECDINFLTGKGVASKGTAKAARIREHFSPVRLADWSKKRRPDACEW